MHLTLKSIFLFSLTPLLCLQNGLANDTGSDIKKNMFAFLTSTPADGSNITAVSSWLPGKAAGADGFVRVNQKGEFFTDSGPIKFWGTNLVYEANFPDTKEKAEQVAVQLARFGFNCIRLHHMDHSGHGIWEGSPDNKTISQRKLELLDYFIYQLKRQGIYININLHVLRELGKGEGFDTPMPTQMGKGINEIDPRMIELQKKYAKDLLTHVNPYTKLSYCEDPAIAFIELNNENSLLNWWRYGALDNMVEEYAKPFRERWNQWLKKKYGNDHNLKKIWNIGSEQLGGEMLANTDFDAKDTDGKKAWELQSHPYLEVKEEQAAEQGPDGKRVRRLLISKRENKSLGPQLVYVQPMTVEKGKTYTVSLFARAGKTQYLKVNCMKSYAPWGVKLGLDADIQISTEWEKYSFVFTASESDDRARITLIMDPQGEYELSCISFRKGGELGLLAGQSLEDNSVPLVKRHKLSMTHQGLPGLHDFIDFIYEAEADYNRTMYDYIRNELKAKALIAGSQVHVSPIGLQARLDFVDNHTYWHHPVFPRGSSWDKGSGWYVLNEAMVNRPPGTIGEIASRRVSGMAYTVSEYNHAEPNQFVAEGFPILAAFGAFQGWNGLYSFAYSHRNIFDLNYIPGFFDINTSAHKLVHMPACVAMFLRGDVTNAEKTVNAPFSFGMEQAKLRSLPDPEKLRSDLYGLDSKWALCHGIGLELLKDGSPQIAVLGNQINYLDASIRGIDSAITQKSKTN